LLYCVANQYHATHVIIASGGQPTEQSQSSSNQPMHVASLRPLDLNRQSSPKLDLILNINVLESSPSASPFPHLLHKPLRVVSSNTRDFYYLQVLATSSLLVQVILSRPVEALTPMLNHNYVAPNCPALLGSCIPMVRTP